MDADLGLHTKGAVQSYFSMEGHVLATRSADAYNAIDKSRNASVTLWLLRHPLAINSPAVKRFLSRLKMLTEIKPAVCPIQGYGVDNGGTAFCVMESLDGAALFGGRFEQNEAERRFIACVTLVKRLHENKIVCGDICDASFWISRSGELGFIGVMGSFDTEATATAMLPPMEILQYVAPEQRSGGGLEQASDVFALGVLGYYLFTRRFPFGKQPPLLSGATDLKPIAKPSELLPSAPFWLDQVLLNCLEFDPAQRYKSAGDILDTILSLRAEASHNENMPQVKDKPTTANIEKKIEKSLKVKAGELATQSDRSVTTTEKKRVKLSRPKVFVIVAAAVTGMILVIGLIVKLFEEKPSIMQTALQPNRFVAEEKVQKALDVIASDESSFAEKSARIDELAGSSDPNSYDSLINIAKYAKTDSLRKLGEKSIIDRARRVGLIRSAEIVKRWLDNIGSDVGMPSSYESVLRSLDTSLPIVARGSGLRETYANNSDLALKLTAALALDSNEIQQFQEILGQLVGDSLKLDDATTHSPLALILATPVLAEIFGDDVVQRRDQIPDSELFWLLSKLSLRADTHIRAIASATIERGLVEPVKSVFLTTIRDRGDVPTEVLQALVRAVQNTMRSEDIASFGRWYDISIEKILLAVCFSENNPDVLLEAFDTVSARTLSIEPSASLIEWVRKNHWADRLEFVRAIGILANLEFAESSKIEPDLKVFDKYTDDPELISILLDSGQPMIVRWLVERYKTKLGLSRLLYLLDNNDREIRLSTIKVLGGYNDLGVLRIIIDHFENEKDPVVREAYKNTFWFIKQRVDGTSE